MPSKLKAKRKARKERYQADVTTSSAGATAPSPTEGNITEGLHIFIPF